ncbi:MAG: hypothetical protein ACERLM_07635, partial [Acidimicrobiales bacterium]
GHGGGGCGDDDDSNSAEQINGTWADEALLWTFESDGSYSAIDEYSATGDLWETGTYTFDGSILTIDTDDESTGACNLTIGSYEVTFSDPDTMSLELIDDECPIRGADSPGSWVRVEED